MNYKSFDDSKTWESEDCETVLAEYYICEPLLHNKSFMSKYQQKVIFVIYISKDEVGTSKTK